MQVWEVFQILLSIYHTSLHLRLYSVHKAFLIQSQRQSLCNNQDPLRVLDFQYEEYLIYLNNGGWNQNDFYNFRTYKTQLLVTLLLLHDSWHFYSQIFSKDFSRISSGSLHRACFSCPSRILKVPS